MIGLRVTQERMKLSVRVMRLLRMMVILYMLALLGGCHQSERGDVAVLNKVTIKIGLSGKDFLEKNNLTDSSVQRQPAGLDFYRHRWPADDQGKVEVQHGDYGFIFYRAISIQCVEDQEERGKGLYSCTVNFAFSDGGEAPHGEVKEDFYRFINKLYALGWRPWIQHDFPRLKGKEAFPYLLEGGAYIAPLDYKPSLEEWMALKSPSWEFYADGVHLGIRFRRDRKRMNPESAGAYLFTASLETAEQRMKSYIAPEDRDNWRDLIDGRLESLTKRRAEKEALLEERGFTIDVNYRDPEI